MREEVKVGAGPQSSSCVACLHLGAPGPGFLSQSCFRLGARSRPGEYLGKGARVSFRPLLVAVWL